MPLVRSPGQAPQSCIKIAKNCGRSGSESFVLASNFPGCFRPPNLVFPWSQQWWKNTRKHAKTGPVIIRRHRLGPSLPLSILPSFRSLALLRSPSCRHLHREKIHLGSLSPSGTLLSSRCGNIRSHRQDVCCISLSPNGSTPAAVYVHGILSFISAHKARYASWLCRPRIGGPVEVYIHSLLDV